ncbi:hypothetical protein RO3G_14346 [Rhizopus delemar RA 99-880]|uniref:Reverse transcriptase domain-containing protein n=1 Tax=Rhizopus delemar (strain RA 99-880 / ATCC MYA-4621 / FGSC 9543 / NRRL 43880) TaxID=246409 RepID=I1CMF5_RHIO9|nr:hypothetical protein RO3G_14346 [Rhizopus delemar RA 99-880]|eukprot:EIE89635.1 hypothetical protein RO3G_14346 [Rhizopus delemar RA 99-880]
MNSTVENSGANTAEMNSMGAANDSNDYSQDFNEGSSLSSAGMSIQDDSAMVVDSGSDFVSSSVVSNKKEDNVAINLTQLRSEMDEQLKMFCHVRASGDDAAIDEALRGIDKTKRRIAAMLECQSFYKKLDMHQNPTGGSNAVSAGLSLSHRDLPKFQLATSVIRPFPNEEVFESVEHFLTKFENIIEGSSYQSVEHVWKKSLPLCLPYSDNAWVKTELKRCRNWSEARQAFVGHHGSSMSSSYYNDLVFTMTMSSKESISDYSKKFLQAVFYAGLPKDDPRIADHFLASLTLPVQTIIRMTVTRVEGKRSRPHNWTVEYLSQVGRDVLGDDNSLYAEATAMIPGANRVKKQEGVDHGLASKHRISKPIKANKLAKSFFCSHHGKNGTHNSKDCYSLKNRAEKNTEKKENNCYKCHQPWFKGHVCKKDETRRVLAVSKVEKQEESQIDKATAEVEAMMEDLSYDCKYPSKSKNKACNDNSAFNLLTPIFIENTKLIGLIDTESDASFIDVISLNKKLKINKVNKITGSYNFLSHNNEISRIGVTDPLQFKYANGIQFKHSLEVMKFNKEFEFDILLGTDILPKMNIGLTGVAFKLDGEHSHSDTTANDNLILDNINIDRENKHEPDNSPAGTPNQRAEFFKIIKEAIDKNQSIPIESSCPMPESIIHLPTKEGATAYRRQYPIPHALRPVLDKQIKKWLETGTIIKSKINTSFNSPLLLVPKRNKAGEIVNHRVCLDVRLLNKILPPSFNYPVPLIRDMFDNLAGKKVFTTLDLSNAYHRFKVAPEDVHKLTFTHNNAQYSFIKGCFGVKMLTSQFQKCLATLFDGIDCVQNFVDDCIIASDSYEQHVKDVKLVIDKLTSVNLIINPEKCVWFQQSVRLLGFVVNTTGTKVDRKKLTNVENWPLPNKSNKQIQQFMGLINYFREYIPMISRVAEPITRLSNAANVEELWTDEQTNSFYALKKILQSDMILHYPNLNKKFYVATDASLYGVAAVLYQKDEHDRDKYISFISSSLTPSQRRWSTTKRELYAIVLALNKFRKFLWGRHFTVYSDHKALVYLHTQKIANPMMIGWIETFLDLILM